MSLIYSWAGTMAPAAPEALIQEAGDGPFMRLLKQRYLSGVPLAMNDVVRCATADRLNSDSLKALTSIRCAECGAMVGRVYSGFDGRPVAELWNPTSGQAIGKMNRGDGGPQPRDGMIALNVLGLDSDVIDGWCLEHRTISSLASEVKERAERAAGGWGGLSVLLYPQP